MSESDAPDSIAWPRVLAVVVTHNGRRWLPGCLKSLAMQTYPAIEVIVVDCASDDPEGVRRLVGRLLSGASILRLERNVGFGAAANRALELSPDARSADYYLFVHDDAALDPDCVGLLVAAALETNAGVVGGKGLSWDEPEVLLEVGMSADEFGYPVSGLEEGEIDQSQHDTRREVLFVTSACILVSRAAVERCGSWDGEYFLFGEDLDLCMRARLCGFPVVVTPAARFYHAVAMATGRREGAPNESVRYFTRRNRLRTIAKNASATRVLILIALYTGLLGAEVVLLAGLRRFNEIPPYLRAYGWFTRSLPDVARRRRAVQRRRTVPDRRVRRYMVRDVARARIFLERRLVQWGVGTMRLGQKTFAAFTPSALAGRVSRWSRSPAVGVSAVIAVVLLLAGRHLLLGSTVGAGSLWPFPASPHRLFSDYFASWRDVGLGTGGAPPPSLPILWLVDVVAFGHAGVAQKFLVAALLGAGLAGMFRFMRRRTVNVGGQILAVAVYALAPVLRLAVTTGDLGALGLYALAPYLVECGFRMLGPVPGSAPGPTPGSHAPRPAVALTADDLTRSAIRLGLLSALCLALAPSALVALVALWLVAGILTGAERASDAAGRRLWWVLASLLAAVAVLVPWSVPALGRSGAILGPLFAGAGGGPAYRSLWRTFSFSHLTLLAPGVTLFAGVATVAALAGALLLASTSRRREARMLAAVVIGFTWWAGLAAKGWLPAPAATPGLWLVLPLFGLAVCAGYMAAAVAEDIPRRVAGWRQVVAAVSVGVLGIGLAGGWAPTLLSWPAPPASPVSGTGSSAAALAALQGAASGAPDFRVLWVGSAFVDPVRGGGAGSTAVGDVPYLVTGADGLSMLDASPPSGGAGAMWLRGAVDDLLTGRTHLAGHLLATAAIRYLVVLRDDLATAAVVARQQDMGLVQELSDIDLYQIMDVLPVAGDAPPSLGAATGSGAQPVLQAQWASPPAFRHVAGESFAGTAAAPSPVLLAEPFNAGWRATVAGKALAHSEAFGWANAFAVPAGVTGTVQVDYRHEWHRVGWVLLEAALLLLALAMATVGHVTRPGGHSEGVRPGARRPTPGPLAGIAAPSARPPARIPIPPPGRSPVPGRTTPLPGRTTPLPGRTTPPPDRPSRGTTPPPDRPSGGTTPPPDRPSGGTTPLPGRTTPLPGRTPPPPGRSPLPGRTTPPPGRSSPPGRNTPPPGRNTPPPGGTA
ncbi:MAG TPA: glycosyltransferase [Actinomycetota bacterium]|nr:glycosyltransferase [Actinomycetota bacterium]